MIINFIYYNYKFYNQVLTITNNKYQQFNNINK
jgi:hypothetical protein